MADRTVLVKLVADVKGLVAGFRTAQQQSMQLNSKIAAHARENEQAYNTLGTTLLGVGLAAGAGLGVAVKAFANFDSQMSVVQAATNASGESMEALREAAIQAGADTAFSAVEAAQAIEEMAKAGVSTEQILNGGLNGALALAAAGGLDVARASEIAATAMVQFGLSGEQIPHVADLLAAGAGKAQGGVEQLAQALEYAGVPASNFGLSIEATTGTLALFASAGIVGQKAGTAFRSMLTSLANPAGKTAELMDELGLSFYDAQGNFIGVTGLADELRDKLGGLTEQQRNAALAQIFGNEALAAAQTLYGAGGEGVDEWIAKVDDSGYAAETAAARMDNLGGDLEALGGSIETAMIRLGENTDGPLRGLVQRMEAVVNIFGSMPAPLTKAVTVATAATAAIGLVGGAALLATPKLVGFYDALGKMGKVGGGAQRGIRGVLGILGGPWGLALSAAAVGLTIFADKQLTAQMQVDSLADSLDSQSSAITDNTRDVVIATLEQEGMLAAAQRLGIGLDVVTEAALGNKAAQRELNGELEGFRVTAEGVDLAHTRMGGSTRDNYDAQQLLRDGIAGSNEKLAEARDQHERVVEAQGKAKGSTDELSSAQEGAADSTGMVAGALDVAADSADAATDSIDAFEDALRSLNEPYADARAASRAYEAALDDFDAELKQARADGVKHAQMLDINTESGRKLQAALDKIADEARQEAVALMRSGESADVVRGKMDRARNRFIAAAQSMGYSAGEARNLANKLFAIPRNVTSKVAVSGVSAALGAIQSVSSNLTSLNGKTALVTITRRTIESSGRVRTSSTLAQAQGGVVDYYGDGGMRERHVAQIAPAGSWRVWGEPETGGEAYIPLARSKRARSMAILDEVAQRFGGAVRYYANGGQTLAGSRAVAPPVNVDAPQVRVFIGERELSDLVRVEVDGAEQRTARALHHGRRV